jgi:FixJ family two-component response regulator
MRDGWDEACLARVSKLLLVHIKHRHQQTVEKPRKCATSEFVVLVVEDDLAVLNSLTFSLEIEGFKVHGHAAGEELLNAENLADCDCFVIDQKLPGMSGLELIAKLRDRHIDTPAILITSHPSSWLRKRAEKADVPIVEKPLLGNTLLDRINDVRRPRD